MPRRYILVCSHATPSREADKDKKYMIKVWNCSIGKTLPRGTHVRHFALDTTAAAGADMIKQSEGAAGATGLEDAVRRSAEETRRRRAIAGASTRVSVDFRCCVREHFDPEWRTLRTGVVYEHERREMRFIRDGRGQQKDSSTSATSTWVAHLNSP